MQCGVPFVDEGRRAGARAGPAADRGGRHAACHRAADGRLALTADCDPSLLTIVLVNLLGNAVQLRPPGGGLRAHGRRPTAAPPARRGVERGPGLHASRTRPAVPQVLAPATPDDRPTARHRPGPVQFLAHRPAPPRTYSGRRPSRASGPSSPSRSRNRSARPTSPTSLKRVSERMSTKTDTRPATFIDEGAIITALIGGARADAGRIREILAKAGEAQRASTLDEVAGAHHDQRPRAARPSCSPRRAPSRRTSTASASCSSRRSTSRTSARTTACTAPSACATRSSSAAPSPRTEIRHEIEILVDQGHKRVLLVAGESYPKQGFQLRARLGRDASTTSSAATARSAASTSTWRRSPSTSSGRSRRPASAPTSSSRRPTTARPTARCTSAAARRTTTGA